ncbi:type IV pilus assembly protein PilC [Acetoanaerobium pronyense]|uniref:Type IV pilus assembly protein PilC n=1 Tax=Acetoanaerobium pronyense TaxID=1482736 RepID=A0ABS4KHU8_9FIRM|nr:type II secretion system F family protein [Acetoanaerobium pronyense]MBP2027362.1 type IV pilus assembly protein PilC [Acetoanaerobium pronyense]
MAETYKYKGLDSSGRVIEGIFHANSKEEVIKLIRDKGQSPIKIEKNEAKSKDLGEYSFFKPRVKIKDISVFCKQLYTMLNAGMPLTNCLDVLAAQTENKTLKNSVKEMSSQVQTGAILSEAMKNQKRIFPNLLVTMVEAGEMTGNLDNVLARMSEHYEKENKINSKIKGAMVYPAILSFAAVGVVIFLLTFIMPTFVGMFTSSGVELPLPTRILMSISDALSTYWYIFTLIFIGIAFLVSRLVRTKDGKRFFDKVVYRLPVVGQSMVKISTSRYTRTLSTLLGSGIPIVDAMEASASVTGNMMVIDGMENVIDEVKKGINISYLLQKMNYFPPMMISMIGIGEESGALEDMLGKTADYYDEELESSIQKMLSMLEPLLILFMGVIIGFIVIAMMMPMFDMTQTIG